MDAIADLAGRIDPLFDWVDPGGPGCSVALFQDGETVFARGYGLANIEHRAANTADTVFHVASISKQFTAMAAGLLQQDGLLSPDMQLGAFFPGLRCGHEITLGQVLHHTSGLRDQWGLLDLAGWRHEDLKTTGDILGLAMRQRSLNFEPGARFQYINTGYTLLGLIVEQVTGQPLRDFARTRIFEPLGMTRTLFHDDPGKIVPGRADAYDRDDGGALKINNPAYATAGPTGLFSTVSDFAAWERNFLSPAICDPALIAAMQRSGTLPDGTETGYGHGLALGSYRGLRTAGHAGGDAAFRSHYLRFPEERFAIAIFCNTAERTPGELAKQIADRVLAHRFTDAGASSGAAGVSRANGVRAPDIDALMQFCGRYREPGGHDMGDLVYRDGIFRLCAAGGDEYELAPLDAATFAFAGLDAVCRIERVDGRGFRMRTYYGGTETAMLESVGDSGPVEAPPDPGDYTGDYFSEELDIRYRVLGRDGALWLDRGRKGAQPMTAIDADQFAAPGGLAVRFRRSDGRVDGMLVNTERVWNVAFARRPGPATGPDRATDAADRALQPIPSE